MRCSKSKEGPGKDAMPAGVQEGTSIGAFWARQTTRVQRCGIRTLLVFHEVFDLQERGVVSFFSFFTSAHAKSSSLHMFPTSPPA